MPTMLWSAGYTVDQMITLLPRIKAMNTDVLFNYEYCLNNPAEAHTEAELLKYLDACYQNGLKAYMDIRRFTGTTAYGTGPNPDYTSIDANINAFKNHPALYGWYMNDESSATQYPASLRETVYNYVKSKDINPNHLLFEVHYQIETGAYDAKAHDVFSIEMYPYTSTYNGTNESTVLNNLQTNLITYKSQLNPSDTRLVACIQAFGEPPGFVTPPSGGVTKIWNVAKQTGWDWGAGAFRLGPQSGNNHYIFDTAYMETEVTQVFAERTTPQYVVIGHIAMTRNGNQFTVMAYDVAGNVRPALFNWSTSDLTIATIDQNGLLTPIGKGIINVRATDIQDGTKTQFLNVVVGEIPSFTSTFTLSQTPKLGQSKIGDSQNITQTVAYSLYQLGTTNLLDLNSILGTISTGQSKTISFDLVNTGTISTTYILGSPTDTTQYSTDNLIFSPQKIITLASNATQTVYWKVAPNMGDIQAQLKINPIYITNKG